ncbi:hypothetical protein [Sphingosinicella microcystinivorans]|uniref:hypothetical protein n=1 Tax=Sphingosinicella microcystinivorans TaxID=335406 RepID=UPI0022F3DC0E|nr:hypothetical protein [Sphingosinicella microcystinivorans]WBX86225.1 hypothetical protein PE061_10075 [Sphingosinicella microcystinivorans]
MIRLALVAAIGMASAMASGTALAQAAQTDSNPAESKPPVTNSGVLKRVPLDDWMPEKCPNPERRGEIVVCGRPDEEPAVETPPEPGEPGTDVPSERLKLTEPGNVAPSSACSAVGPAGDVGCSRNEYEQWRRERQLQKAREKVPKPK